MCVVCAVLCTSVPLPPVIDPAKMFGKNVDPKQRVFQCLPKCVPMCVVVSVYIIKGMDLHPTDVNGKVRHGTHMQQEYSRDFTSTIS